MGFGAKIKDFIKKYGMIGLACHVGLSIIFLCLIFLLVTYGIDLQVLLLKIGINLNKYEWSKKAGKYGIIVGINQILAPVRYMILLVIVPIIGRKFGKKEENCLSEEETSTKEKSKAD